MPDPNLCVLIDFENIAAGTEKAQLGKFNIRSVMDRLKEKGRILIARAYGDWGRYAKFKQDLLREGVSMMELTSYRGQDKNRADIALVVDAMELAFTREHIDTYVLLSGDSDFTPLVMKLREFNKRVIGVGTRQSTSRLLSAACDEFIFYENIRRGRIDTDSPSEEEGDAVNLTKVEVFAKLVETLEGLVRDTSGPVSSGVLKQSLLRKLPTFDEAEFGFTGFARFLENAHAKGLISIHTDSRAGGYLVSLAENAPVNEAPEILTLPKLSDEAERLRDILIAHKANPGTHLMRHVLVHELVDNVQERAARKKRNTLFYLYGYMNRKCRKTDPLVPPAMVRSIIDALHDSGTILHPDGDPVRSHKANFVLKHEPDELLSKLRDHYLKTLLNAKETLDNSIVLSELLWGDEEHQQEIEEAVSWLIRDNDSEETAPQNDNPSVASNEHKGPHATNKEATVEPRNLKNTTKVTKGADSFETDNAEKTTPTDADVPTPTAETKAPPRARKGRRRTQSAVAKSTNASETKSNAMDLDPETTKITRTRKKAQKSTETESENAAISTDIDEKPKKNRTRRKKSSTDTDSDTTKTQVKSQKQTRIRRKKSPENATVDKGDTATQDTERPKPKAIRVRKKKVHAESATSKEGESHSVSEKNSNGPKNSK
ncbi:MAG: NYN domain-containing protein [Myxococcota bacterium]|nr:NYN domain-containing protein [Myxococcota bacterium]